MTRQTKVLKIVLVALFCALVNGCAQNHLDFVEREQVVVALKREDDSLAQKMAPVFQLFDTRKEYNRIGRVHASGTKDAHSVAIDPDHPVFYIGTSHFSTAKNRYTNLIYRVHFLEQPFSLVPFHYGAGRHVGLLVILTLDERHQVVLVTTAQTCGCYAVSIPTKALSRDVYPADWPSSSLSVAGEHLPSQLPAIGPEDLLQIVLRPEIHRVMDVSVISRTSLADGVEFAAFADLASLKKLPLDDGATTSFYYRDWPLAGHVKGAIKPWETLLLGIVSLDMFVGMDKEFGDSLESGNPFYTSLKPWNRTSSDLNNFAQYLRFNGWRL